jgi:single-stranded-DNA-specific exonuclease
VSKLTKHDIDKLLSARFADDSCNSLKDIPSPSLFKDIDKASFRINEAIDKKEKITIVGDYDVDGVVSSVIMSEFFEDIGVEIDLIIPNRFKDGYGINEKLLQKIDANLIITVDNGISAVEAANVCKKRGIDLIITDHHTVPPILPDAYAIVNPKQEDCAFPHSEICGAQVAWYMVASIKERLGIDYNLGKFLDLLAIAIVADMMELKGINRTMVKAGFKMINQEKRVIFSAIKAHFRKSSFVSDDISFLLSPIINSAGRLEDASLSYDMLRSTNIDEASVRLEYIVSLNNRRKEIEFELFKLAITKHDESKDMVIVWGDSWHEGVIGIVAARLSRRFKKPAIVFSITGDIAKGSARSVGDIDILSLISTQKDLLLGFGGHKGAAGMSIKKDKLEIFRQNLQSIAKDIPKDKFIQKSEVLGEIDAKEVDLNLINILQKYEPYGQKNPQPKFLLKNAYVIEDRVLGVDKNHLKLSLECDGKSLESIYFNFDKKATEGDHIDLICTISKNEFRGDVSVQLMVDGLEFAKNI